MNQQNISAVTGIVSSSTSRRRFLGVGAAAAATVLLGACAGIPTSKNVHRSDRRKTHPRRPLLKGLFTPGWIVPITMRLRGSF